MAGVGPAPAAERKSKKKRPDNELIQAPTEANGYALPPGLMTDRHGDPIPWHPATELWWENWRRSPQSTKMMTQPDWDFLLDTALMHHAMWTYKKWELASEVRLRVSKFGATPEDRARLRMEIHDGRGASVGKEDSSSNVTSINSRRSRIKDA